MTAASSAAHSATAPAVAESFIGAGRFGWIFFLLPAVYGIGIALGKTYGAFTPTLWAEWTTLLGCAAGGIACLRVVRQAPRATGFAWSSLAFIAFLALAGIATGSLSALGSAVIQRECLWVLVSLTCAGLIARSPALAVPATLAWALANCGLLLLIAAGTFSSGMAGGRVSHVWSGLNVNIVVNAIAPVLLAVSLLKSPHRARLALLVGLALAIVLAVMTGRRLALAVGGVVFFTWAAFHVQSRLRWIFASLALAGVAAVIGATLVPNPLQRADDAFRPLVYAAAWDGACAHPLTGLGLVPGIPLQDLDAESARLFTASSEWVTHVHSTPLQIVITGGAPAFICWLAALAFAGRALWRCPHRLRAVLAAIGGGFCLTALFDPSIDAFLGRLNVAILIGIGLGAARGEREAEPPGAPLIPGFAACLAFAMLCMSLPTAFTFARDDIFPFRSALVHAQDLETLGNVFDRIAKQAPAVGQDWVLADAIGVSRKKAGWFGSQVAIAANRPDLIAAEDRISALVTLLQRTPFQDQRYLQLAPLLTTPAGRAVPERIARRALTIAKRADPAELLRDPLATDMESLADHFCALAAITDKRALDPAELEPWRNLVIKAGHCKGVALLSLWISLHQAGHPPQEILLWNPRIRWALRDESSLAGMRAALPDDDSRQRFDQTLKILLSAHYD